MQALTSRTELAAVLALPAPVAYVDGVLARAPEQRVWLGPCSLGQVLRWTLSPRSLRWVEGTVRLDPAAAARARLSTVAWRDAHGTPLCEASTELPGGLVDRLLFAADQADGYRPPEPPVYTAGLASYGQAGAQLLSGLFAQAPEAAVWVHPYDFATLAAAEAAATVAVPGGEVRVEVAAWPLILAAVMRAGEEPGAAPLLDLELARELPYGAARAIVEAADALSETGGPAAAVRFLDHQPRPSVDGTGAVAAAGDRTAAQ